MGLGHHASHVFCPIIFSQNPAAARASCRRSSPSPRPFFAFGLVAFGFLGMGPVTIAVDSLRAGDRQRPVGLRAKPD